MTKFNRIGWQVLVLALTGCGDDAEPNEHGSLLDLTTEPAGSNCEAGGLRAQAGRDRNGNGSLEPDEVETTSYVCNGASARDGRDGDPGKDGRDGAPGNDGENGRDGEDGRDGKDGEDGKDGKDAEAPPVTVHRGAGPGVAGFRLISKFTAPGGPIAEIIAATPDGNTLVYTSSVDQSVGFLDLTTPRAPVASGSVDIAETVPNHAGQATSVAVTPDGRYAVVTVKDTTDPIGRADPGRLVFIEIASRTIAGSVVLGVGPDSVRLTPDGSKAVIAIEDEEDADDNGVEQARPGSVQIVTIDYDAPSESTVATIPLELPLGNLRADPQPEFVDVTPDGRTAVVSLQENNAIAVIDIEAERVVRYIDAGTSLHARADLNEDGAIDFSDPAFTGLLEPDAVCVLPDGVHFVTANEGDTPNGTFEPGLWAGGRGFSVFRLDGTRVYDSGDAVEWLALRSGAYAEGRSGDRGVEIEGCAAATFGDRDYAFLLGERNASLFVVDMATPSAPVLTQLLGAPMRPEGVLALPDRNLVIVSGEGDDDTGGGVWIYEAVTDPDEVELGPNVYDARSFGVPFGALGALAYDARTGFVLATPDNAFAAQVVWSFWPDHRSRRMVLTSETILRDAAGEPLTGHDPEGIALNPEGGLVLVSEGVAANGGSTSCEGSVRSNRILFFDEHGRLDPSRGTGGIVDLPCGSDPQAIDWSTIGSNGFEGVAVVDGAPLAPGGLKVYVAFQRPLAGEGQNTRIGEYDVDTGTWNFYYYPLDPSPGGPAGNIGLSELLHVEGDLFAVIERDQGWAGDAGVKTIRTFRLSSGVPNDIAHPVEKRLVVDLLDQPFRFDQEKIEGLALGGGSLWVTNDNDGGEAPNFFLKLDPTVLGLASDAPVPSAQ